MKAHRVASGILPVLLCGHSELLRGFTEVTEGHWKQARDCGRLEGILESREVRKFFMLKIVNITHKLRKGAEFSFSFEFALIKANGEYGSLFTVSHV